MNNVENPWLQKQKKLIAKAFIAWRKPRIIPRICAYNLQQLPSSDRPKWLSAMHKAQLITAMNLELDQHTATAWKMLILGQPAAPSLQLRQSPLSPWLALTTIYCPIHHTTIIITLLKFHWAMAKVQSIYWYFPASGNWDCHQLIMGRAFYALLWTSSWIA